MKKTVIALFAIAMISMVSVSCKKKCECTTTGGGMPATTATLEITSGQCSDNNATVTTMGVTMKTECKDM